MSDFDDDDPQGLGSLPEDCRKAVERALVAPPEGPEEREEALEEASVCLRDALRLNDDSVGLWIFLGEVELLRGDHADAEQAYLSAVRLDPDDALIYSGLAHSCAAQGRAEDAEEWLEQGLRVEPTSVLYGQLGQLQLEAGRMEEAEGAFRTGLALDPDDAELLFLLARFFARDEEEAERLLAHAVEVEPDHLFAWHELGVLRLSVDDLEGARACFDTLIELAPDIPDGYRELAVVELDGNPQRAVELARTALERDRDDPASWTVLGQALSLTDSGDEAERALLTGCAIRPLELDGARTHWTLADLYAREGRFEDALGTLHAVDHFAPACPEIAADLGRAYAELGRDREARDWLQVALEHDVDDEESRALLQRLEAEAE